MKKISRVLLIGCTLLWGMSAFADNAQMQQTLVCMINQIDALFPLIDKAKAEQDSGARVQFHFDSWVDNNGVQHDGFRQSMLAMREALVDEMRQTNLTPQSIQPMNDDFVGR